MGYWINHNIKAIGNKEDIEAYVSKLTQRHPESLNDEGDIVWSEEEFSFYNIISPPEEMLMSGDWWGQEGKDWMSNHWETDYDWGPGDVHVFSNPITGNYVTNISISTKYDWPINIFHELIKQYPSLEFNMWSEGEESEAVHITGTNGISVQTNYDSPNSHADWEARDDLGSCWCSHYEEESEWYDDCPRDTPGLFKVIVTHTHYITAPSINSATDAIKAYEDGFDMPANTTMTTYNPVPEILITPEEVTE